MPTYTFQCTKCDYFKDVFLSSVAKRQKFLDNHKSCCCGHPVRQLITTPPTTVIPHHMQAAPNNKSTYYGVDPISGKGIEKLDKDWNQGTIKTPKSNNINTVEE